MPGSTIEQLKAWWTPARKTARLREDRLLRERYAGRYVAFTDDWDGEELVRTVVAVAATPVEFRAAVAGLDPDVRRRARLEPISGAGDAPFA